MRRAPTFIVLNKIEDEFNPIRMSVSLTEGKRAHVATGEYVKVKHWDKKSCRISDRYVDLYPDYSFVNQRLDDLTHFTVSLITDYRRRKELYLLTPEKFRFLVKKFLRDGEAPEGSATDVLTYYKSYVDRRQKEARLKDGTKKHELASYRAFERFVKSVGYQIGMDEVKLSLFEAYRDFLGNEPSAPLDVTISRHMKRLKEALSKAYVEGLIPQFNPNEIKLSAQLGLTRQARENIALDKDQLNRIIALDLSHRPGLRKLRDLFVINCYLGLRFNRWQEINGKNIVETDGVKLLEIITKKGKGKKITIPVHPTADKIASKYGWNFGRVMTNQKANKYLQEIAQMAGFTENFKRVARRGQRDTVEQIPMYKLISTHTARRTFVTIHAANGMPLTDIQGLTGHGTREMVEHYSKETPTARAVRIAKKFFNN
ncbi:site-specific integrase [Neolewinella aurantiaca]|uniref:Site-specific integrase n=1 Tax=Neolewinella aurantiaca TaxID=2602767 RepID=A0A5C7FMC6_9BACT|nr:phage integrase SAM-like domain-containing protein [Neolewinella aurantiaca]TXF91220.1 site-specific integrase [Neolewinella aurantiaca]